jgi:hypothetical protein
MTKSEAKAQMEAYIKKNGSSVPYSNEYVKSLGL